MNGLPREGDTPGERSPAESRRRKVREQMTDKPKEQHEGLSLEELEAQNVERLPDREEMSLVDVNVALPVNPAVSAIVFSEGSTADAGAEQDTPNDQSNN